MTEFDTLLEKYTSGRTRTKSVRERYPTNILLDADFLDILQSEYYRQVKPVAEGGKRNSHSNFLKAISFEIDKCRDNPAIRAKHQSDDSMDTEVETLERKTEAESRSEN